MSSQDKPASWWTTLPGVITGLAAIVTALTGLIVAIKQTGWFDSDAPHKPAAAATSTSARPAPVPPASNRSTQAVALPDLRDYKLGEATFTLLKADLSPQTTEKDALQIRVRMTSRSQFDSNFSDRYFRLVVNDVPMAPENTLNEIVPAQSGKEGEVIFVVPRGTAGGKLKISYSDGSTEIPLVLGSADKVRR